MSSVKVLLSFSSDLVSIKQNLLLLRFLSYDKKELQFLVYSYDMLKEHLINTKLISHVHLTCFLVYNDVMAFHVVLLMASCLHIKRGDMDYSLLPIF